MNRNYGFIPPIIDETQFIFGSGQLGGKVIRPDGQWLELAVEDESQVNREGVDPANCTVETTLTIVEFLLKIVFGVFANYSDRFLTIISKIRPPGASPQVAAEALRHLGCVNEEDLPFDDSIKSLDDYLQPDPLPDNLIKKALAWLDVWSFGHDWLSNGDLISPDIIKEALKYSPIGVAVFAWIEKDGVYYRPEGAKDVHFTVIRGYEDGKYWYVKDSYSPHNKKLDWNFKFYFAKRYVVGKAFTQSVQFNLISWVLDKIALILSFLTSLAVKTSEKQPIPAPETSKPIPTPPLPQPAPEPPKKSRIVEWAEAIKIYEDAPLSWFNPGAIKGKDGTFLHFPNYQAGFDYLCDYLTRAATGKHKAYPKGGETTLQEFTRIYAPSSDKNNPEKYCHFVAGQLEVKTSITIKELV